MPVDIYDRFQRSGRPRNGSASFSTSTDDTTLITVTGATYTIYVQKIFVYIKTDAVQSISFEDSNSSAKQIYKIPTSPGAATQWTKDFGPRGIPLTIGKSLVANVSGTGLAFEVQWQAYQTPNIT